MLLRLVRRLIGLGVSVALVMGVTTYLGPQLAARSMHGYIQVFDQAQSGHYAGAGSTSASLERDWRDLSAGVAKAVTSLQHAVAHLTASR